MSKIKFTYRKIPTILATTYLVALLLIGLFGSLFTSNVPWKTVENEKTSYPAITRYLHSWGLKKLPAGWMTKDWSAVDNKTENFIPYDPSYIDITSLGAVPPGKSNHILGTDLLGRDVLSGLISGANISLRIAFLSTFVAVILAYLLVFLTSYIGDNTIFLSLLQMSVVFVLACLSYFYIFIAFTSVELGILIQLFRIIIFIISVFLIFKLVTEKLVFKGHKTYAIPFDTLGLKMYEIFYSFPKLIILLILIGVLNRNGDSHEIVSMAFVLSLLLWPVFYRYLRLEILREKSTEFYISLKNLGFSEVRIALRHFLPSSFQAIIVPVIFVFSATILAEATLSFLGLGLSDEWVSWGKLLSQARQRMSAWWLVLFPGMAIFLTLYSLNILSKRIGKT